MPTHLPVISDPSLNRDPRRLLMLLAVVPSLREVVIFDQRLKGFCQQFSLFTKLLQQHRQQVSARNKSVSSAIESRLNSELSHFHPFFCKELPLNQGRTEIAHLQIGRASCRGRWT